MPTIPVLPPIVTGTLPSSTLSAVVAAVTFLLAPPRAELRQTVAQNLASSGVWVDLTFDVEDLDANVGNFPQHDTSVNTARFTAQYPGWYRVGGGVGYAASVTNRRGARWAVNGTALNGNEAIVAATATGTCEIPARGKLIFLNAGDFLTLQGFQDTGGALLTAVSAGQQPNASIFLVSA
jgi:hypothetical protein